MKTKALKTFGSAEEVESVARGFESCTTAPAEFGHREHLAVALCYLTQEDPGAALERVRSGIYNFLRRHGEDPSGVYNETVTIFWLCRVRSFLDAQTHARTLRRTRQRAARRRGRLQSYLRLLQPGAPVFRRGARRLGRARPEAAGLLDGSAECGVMSDELKQLVFNSSLITPHCFYPVHPV